MLDVGLKDAPRLGIACLDLLTVDLTDSGGENRAAADDDDTIVERLMR